MDRRHLKIDPVKSILVITVFFIVVHLLTKWQGALYISVIIGLLGLISNLIAQKINLVWIKTIWILSLTVPNILLSLIYFLFLIPLAYLSRVFKAQNQLKLRNTNQSMFMEKHGDLSNDSFHKMW